MQLYLCIKHCGLLLCQVRHQHIEFGRPVLRHARAAQRLAVRQRIHAVRAGAIHESLPTHKQLAVGGKHALLDAQYRIRGGRVVNGNGGAGHRHDRNVAAGDGMQNIQGAIGKLPREMNQFEA
jgi:hypothetical protein